VVHWYFYIPKREEEKEREKKRERASSRARARERKRDRENKSAGDYISKLPRPKCKILELHST
jgi:hypothetical protein